MQRVGDSAALVRLRHARLPEIRRQEVRASPPHDVIAVLHLLLELLHLDV